MKTARFKEVVAVAGAPQVHPLWLAPDRDPALKRAVRECRVMTIHQALRGTKADYGTIGLHLEGSTQILVFPKPLRRFGDRRIVGVDYGLSIQPEPKDPAPPVAPPKRKPAAAVRGRSPRPAGADRPRSARSTPNRPVDQAPPAPEPLTRDELLAEIRRALRELKAGKAVAAYERLSAITE